MLSTASSIPPGAPEIPGKKPSNRPAWVRFVALRYLRTRRKEKRNTTAILSVLALSVGLATLITVIAVMNAFQSRTIESVLAVQSFHLRLENSQWREELAKPGQEAAFVSAMTASAGQGATVIQSVTRFADLQALVRGRYASPEALYVRALPSDVQTSFPAFAEHTTLLRGELTLAIEDTVALGSILARSLGANIGDYISISYLDASGSLVPREKRLLVTAVVTYGYGEYDASRALVSYATLEAMLDGQVSWEYGLMLRDKESDVSAIRKVVDWFAQAQQESTGPESPASDASGAVPAAETLLPPGTAASEDKPSIVSWRAYNASLFGALRLEKLMMMLMIGLIFIVVAVNIYYALRRSVLEKSEDIALLRALGAVPTSIQQIFILEGLVIGALGSIFGTLFGVLISLNINTIFAALESFLEAISGSSGSINLFYLDRVPGLLYPTEVLFMAVIALGSAVLAAYGASRRVSRLKTTEILRHE